MSDVTDADREKAAELIAIAGLVWHAEAVPAIAAALAEERQKARAPFLALAEHFESAGLGPDQKALRYAAARIRAAEEIQ